MNSANESKDSLGAGATKGRRAWNWKRTAIAASLFLLVFGLAYNRHALADLGKTDFDEVQLTRGLILNKKPVAPFSGTLLLRDDQISLLGTTIFADTNLQQWTGADTQGLILEASVEAGQLSGTATLYADLRTSEMAGELGSGVGFVLAKWFAPRQKVATAVFKESRLDGKASIWHPVGSGLSLGKLVEANFKENKMHGPLRRFYDNGELRSDMHFEAGMPTGMQRDHYPTGEVSRELEITVTGSSLMAYYRNGQLRLHEVEAAGQRVLSKGWFPDGSQQRVQEFSGGELVNEKRWYSNGALASGGPEMASPDGTIREYYQSGSLRSEHTYVSGRLHGPFKRFYDNDRTWEQGHYLAGELDGQHQKWWKNGQKALEATWKDGSIDGKYQRWYANGTVWEVAEYRHGGRVGPYLKRWKNGTIAHEYEYDKGALEGLYKTFYDNGQSRLEATYKSGKLDGEYKNWLKDGSVYELATYDSGTKIQSSISE
jgi:antitoxin component YwqK of YwqJK toxin-antitoxin module